MAPRILRDVSHVDASTDLLDTTYDLPLGIAPMTLQRAADPDGEVAMARAVAAAGVPMVVSSNSGSTFSDIAATGASWWLQVYLPTRRDDALPLLDAAVAAGAAAVVLTADTPVLGTRYRLPEGPHVWDMAEPTWLNANAPVTSGLHREDRAKAMDLGPTDVAWLAETTGLPVVVKGVLRADDASRCADAGAGAVWISNHGGRQLDQSVATAGCVAAVRAAVPSGVQVYVDGGLRSGLHVMLAAALGADVAFSWDGRCSTRSPREESRARSGHSRNLVPSSSSRCDWPAVRHSWTRGRSCCRRAAEARRKDADLRESLV